MNGLIDDLDAAWRDFMDPALEDGDQTGWQKAFFDSLRMDRGGLTADQVENLKTLIFAWRTYFADKPLDWLAFVLGRIARETGWRLTPMRETGAASEASVLRILDRWWKSGKASQFGVKSRYWDANEFGKHAYGRGYFQLTHHGNYAEARHNVREVTGADIPFDEDYDLALDPLAGAVAAYAGSIVGQFRGRKNKSRIKLADFDRADGFDFYNATDIVNGDKEMVGREVERFCLIFRKALLAGETAVPGWLGRKAAAKDVATVPAPEGTPPMVVPVATMLDLDAIKREAPALIELGIQVHVNFHIVQPQPDAQPVAENFTPPASQG